MFRHLEKFSDKRLSLFLAALIISTILIIFLPIIWISIDQVTRRGEKRMTELEVLRAETILQNELGRLDRSLLDWSAWDDTYRFAQDKNETYILANLGDNSLRYLEISIFLLLDSSRQPVYAKYVDSQTQAEAPLPFEIQALLQAYPHLSDYPILTQGRKGLAVVSGIPMLVAARPILTRLREGPPTGTLIWIRLLDAQELERLSQVTQCRIDLVPIASQPGLPPPETLHDHTFVSAHDASAIRGFKYLEDLNSQPVQVLQIENPRILYTQGRTTALIFTAILLATVIFVFAVSYHFSLNFIKSRRANRQHLQRFQSIVQHSREAILMVRNDCHIMEANPASQDLLAWRPGPVTPTCLRSLMTFEPDLDLSLVQRISRSGEISEHHCIRHDGLELDVELSASPVTEQDNPGFSLIMRDVTTRTQAVNSLRASEERYMLAANGANDGLWDWNLTAGVMYYSSRWKAILGYASDDLSTEPEEWFNRVHPDDHHRLQTALADHLRQKSENFECEHRALHRDGQYRWLLARGIALWDADGVAYRMAGSLTDVSARKNLEELLRHDALHDPLTSLANRTLLLEHLWHANERKKRKPELLFGLFFLDFDRFKQVNDSLGHQFGDQLLIEVSHRLEVGLRATDTICRFTGPDTLARIAGDEFVILLEDFQCREDVYKVAQRISQVLSAPYTIENHEITLTASIGLVIPETHYEHPEDIIRDADIAMYRAKQLGGAQVVLFDPEMYTQILARMELETDLRKALDHGEFEVYYQPIYTLVDDCITGFEALVRWNHPKKGLVMPSEFIQSAEEIGVIIPLGYFVLEAACRAMQSWQKQSDAHRDLLVSVNFSPRQILHTGLVENIQAILDRTGFDPHMLWLEVTESTLLARNPTVYQHLSTLRALGIRIEIDDFGTGYSAFSYLHTLPVDGFKIDRSFIGNIQQGGQQIIKSLVELGQHLGLTQVAEGVETEQQREFLKGLSCNYAQGFLMSRPMPAAEVEKLLLASRG